MIDEKSYIEVLELKLQLLKNMGYKVGEVEGKTLIDLKEMVKQTVIIKHSPNIKVKIITDLMLPSYELLIDDKYYTIPKIKVFYK